MTPAARGVELFFAISGVLITSRILEEERVRGSFNLKGFYIRRFFRIQQPPRSFISAFWRCLWLTGAVHNTWYTWLGAVLVFENFAYRFSGSTGYFYVGHFWTLAVEEHFYAMLSFVLFLRAPMAGSAVRSRIRRLTAGAPHRPPPTDGLKARPIAELTGKYTSSCFRRSSRSLLARPAIRAWARRYLHPWFAILLWPSVLFLHVLVRPHPEGIFAYGPLLNQIGFFPEVFFTLLIVSTMLHGSDPVTRFLELPPLKWIGRLSLQFVSLACVVFLSPHFRRAGQRMQCCAAEPAGHQVRGCVLPARRSATTSWKSP